MCGRFVGFRNMEQLKRYFPIDQSQCQAVANYNIAPGQQILVLFRQNGRNVLDTFHWGLVPFWAKDVSIGNKMINARSETVAVKPSFRNAFKKRRCLILADGFFEWTGQKGSKQPMFITLPEAQPFAFAGLWETWRAKAQSSTDYLSCTIITREAVGRMRKIHHRMPVILPPDVYDTWLDPQNQDVDRLSDLLGSASITEFVFTPVSKQVNAARNNSSSNIQPIQTQFDF